MTNETTEHDAMPDLEAEARLAIAEQEDQALQEGISDEWRDYQAATIQYLSAQVTWLRARTQALALGVRARDDVASELEQELEGYRRSADIARQAIERDKGEPGPPDQVA